MWRAAAVAGVLVLFGAPLAARAAGPDDVEGIGVFTPGGANGGAARWQLRTTPTAGAPELDVRFGTGEQPVAADFNGDGRTDLAVFVPSLKPQAAVWQIRTSEGSVPEESAFAYGGSGSIGVAGDWDGDGKAGIGTFAPASATAPARWRLRNTANSGADDAELNFGKAGSVPVTGDWNGDGKTDIGTFTPAIDDTEAHWDLRVGLGPSSAEIEFFYGGVGSVPVTGDFDGDGTTDIGVYNPPSPVGQGLWQLRLSASGGKPQLEFRYGGPGTVPIAGRWSGPAPAVTPQPTVSPEPTATPVDPPPPPPAATPAPGPRTVLTLPPLNARVTYFWTARGTRLTIGQLVARDLPTGTTVTISCAGKHCPLKKLTVKPKGSSRNLLTTLGKKKVFRAGQTVDVRLTAPGHHTKLLRFKLARGKVPIGRAYCVRVGENKLRAKC